MHIFILILIFGVRAELASVGPSAFKNFWLKKKAFKISSKIKNVSKIYFYNFFKCKKITRCYQQLLEETDILYYLWRPFSRRIIYKQFFFFFLLLQVEVAPLGVQLDGSHIPLLYINTFARHIEHKEANKDILDHSKSHPERNTS